MDSIRLTLDVPIRLIDAAHLKSQSEAAPNGHRVIGPAIAAPFWGCLTCGAVWSNGTHPEDYIRESQPENKPDNDQSESPEDKESPKGFWDDWTPWWVDY